MPGGIHSNIFALIVRNNSLQLLCSYELESSFESDTTISRQQGPGDAAAVSN